MPQIDRRFVINAIAFSGAAALAPRVISAAAAEGAGAADGRPPKAHFGFDDVVRRASDLAAAPYDGTPPKLPDALTKLDFDAYRDIRFKPDKSPITTGPYRLQLFHPGFIYKRPVVVSTIRDGISTPIPFSTSLFDYGHTKFEKNLPVNLGFAGFRLHYPLNSPNGQDELVSFLGATYFRFLGRGRLMAFPRAALPSTPAATTRNSLTFANSGSKRRKRLPMSCAFSPCSTAPRSPAPTSSS